MKKLVNQNKHHAQKHIAILQLMTTWRSYIFGKYPKVAQCHINLSGCINIYTLMECTRENPPRSSSCQQMFGITFTQFPSRNQKWYK